MDNPFDIVSNITNGIFDVVNKILSWVATALPDSPFKMLDMTPLHDYLPYINYFVPLDFMLSSLSAWGTAVAGYYTYHVILRWARAVK